MKKPYIPRLKKAFEKNRKQIRSFITRTEKKLTDNDLGLVKEVEKEVWKEINCLSCANCCKVMTPTYTTEDIKRISKHLGMTVVAFKKKWLQYEKKSRNWVNKSLPCQFLDLKTNKCKIYEVRPADCAGFPHLAKTPFKDYFYIHNQNIEFCPASYLMIEKLRKRAKSNRL